MRCTNVSTTLGEYTREKSSAGSVCTMAGTLSRSKPIPGTGVVATTWNAGIWGAGEGAGAETRAGRAARAGMVARAARRTGGGRGAVTVTSGSVAATCPEATSANIKAPGSGNAPIDRKSTRLNSSHSQISYAVFCLQNKYTSMLY